MTRRTSSATRRNVVSRSSVVLTTSATSKSRGSTLEVSSDLVSAVATNELSYQPQDSLQQSREEAEQQSAWQSGLAARLLRKNAHVRQVTVTLGVIKPVADHKFVGDREPYIVCRYWLLATGRLIKQC